MYPALSDWSLKYLPSSWNRSFVSTKFNVCFSSNCIILYNAYMHAYYMHTYYRHTYTYIHTYIVLWNIRTDIQSTTVLWNAGLISIFLESQPAYNDFLAVSSRMVLSCMVFMKFRFCLPLPSTNLVFRWDSRRFENIPPSHSQIVIILFDKYERRPCSVLSRSLFSLYRVNFMSSCWWNHVFIRF